MPLRYHIFFTVRRCILICIFTWILAFIQASRFLIVSSCRKLSGSFRIGVDLAILIIFRFIPLFFALITFMRIIRLIYGLSKRRLHGLALPAIKLGSLLKSTLRCYRVPCFLLLFYSPITVVNTFYQIAILDYHYYKSIDWYWGLVCTNPGASLFAI